MTAENRRNMEFYFAPMEGITSYTYRNLHHRFFGGVEKYYTPFLSPSAENGLSTRATAFRSASPSAWPPSHAHDW